ncbi:MAG: hypothetical protein ACU0B5_10005, partial [Roseovarius sp.]
IGEDEFLLDEIPDDAGHFVAVHFDDGVFDLDLGPGARAPRLGWVWSGYISGGVVREGLGGGRHLVWSGR